MLAKMLIIATIHAVEAQRGTANIGITFLYILDCSGFKAH